MKRKICMVVIAALAFLLSACAGPAGPGGSGASGGSGDSGSGAPAGVEAPPGVIFLTADGNNIMDYAEEAYEKPTTGAAELSALLTPEVLAKAADGGFKAAYCGHEDASLWSQALAESLARTLSVYGIELAKVTGSNFDVNSQIETIESVLETDIDLLVVYIMDGDAYKNVLDRAQEKGVKVIGVNSPPNNAADYDNYFGTVVPDSYMVGYHCMDLVCRTVGEGEVGASSIIFYSEDSNARFTGAQDAAKKYDRISVVIGPEIAMTVEDATSVGESMIQKNPDLKGYWALWDELAVGVGSGIANLGKNILVSGPDISVTSATSMLTTGMFVGSASISPDDLGKLIATLGAAGLGGAQTPEIVVSPVVIITKENIAETWQYVFGRELDPDLRALLP